MAETSFTSMETHAAPKSIFPTLNLPIASSGNTSPSSASGGAVAVGQHSPSFVHALSLDHTGDDTHEREFKKDASTSQGHSLLSGSETSDGEARAQSQLAAGVFHSISISESDGGIDGVDARHLQTLQQPRSVCVSYSPVCCVSHNSVLCAARTRSARWSSRTRKRRRRRPNFPKKPSSSHACSAWCAVCCVMCYPNRFLFSSSCLSCAARPSVSDCRLRSLEGESRSGPFVLKMRFPPWFMSLSNHH